MPHAYDERGITESTTLKKKISLSFPSAGTTVFCSSVRPQARNVDIPQPTGCKMKNRGPAATDPKLTYWERIGLRSGTIRGMSES
jgi:hypothetical protein